MRLPFPPQRSNPPSSRGRSARWPHNEQGSAAVEFAIVAVPFFLFVLGTLGVGLYFFTANSLEHGVEAAARQIRTGQAQKSGVTVGEFKQRVCTDAGSYIDCDKLHVIVQNASTWSGIDPQRCVDGDNNMTASTGSSGDTLYDYTGGASQVVLITLCYEWDLARSFSFLKLGTGTDGTGSAILQAATAFRTEPYSS